MKKGYLYNKFKENIVKWLERYGGRMLLQNPGVNTLGSHIQGPIDPDRKLLITCYPNEMLP